MNSNRLGFWSAILTVLLTLLFMVVGIATPPRSGPFCSNLCIPFPYTNVTSFVPADYFWLLPGILLAPIFIVLMTCIHNYSSEDKKIFSLIGLSFTIVYATIIALDYFIQFTVVMPSLLSGEVTGLTLFTQYNPHGLFIALEGLGYFMMSIAFLFSSTVFVGGRIERIIQWLFVADFALAVGSFMILFLLRHDLVAFEVAILTINWIVLIISGVLLSILFRRAKF